MRMRVGDVKAIRKTKDGYVACVLLLVGLKNGLVSRVMVKADISKEDYAVLRTQDASAFLSDIGYKLTCGRQETVLAARFADWNEYCMTMAEYWARLAQKRGVENGAK